jgi:hypothetical protein
MDISWLDMFGYAASLVILVSLMMSSIVKLRWINLAGGIMFSAFGFLIGSIPTGALNLGIVLIDIYYLWKYYHEADELAIVEADLESGYFNHFWQRNAHDIEQIFGDVDLTSDQRAFYFIRNNNTAGILVGSKAGKSTLQIVVDYVSRPYRDLKIGQHFIGESRIAAVLPDVTTLRATTDHGLHASYLRKLGFSESPQEPGVFLKSLVAA